MQIYFRSHKYKGIQVQIRGVFFFGGGFNGQLHVRCQSLISEKDNKNLQKMDEQKISIQRGSQNYLESFMFKTIFFNRFFVCIFQYP